MSRLTFENLPTYVTVVPAVPYRFETKEIALLSAGVVLKLKNNLKISLILY